MTEWSLELVGYFDLGSATGAAPTNVSESLAEKDCLETVFCRDHGETTVPESTIRHAFPGGATLPRLAKTIEFVTSRINTRLYIERLFDTLAARATKTCDFDGDIHYHHTPGHIKSLRTANAQGKTTTMAGAVEYTHNTIKRREAEYPKHGLSYETSREKRRMANRREMTLRESDLILAMSNFVAESYIEAGLDPEKIAVVPLGVDLQHFSPRNVEHEGFRAVFVGSVNVMKGIPYLLDAWEQSRLANSAAELRLCGPIEGAIRPLFENCPDNITTTGFVDPLPEYQKADVFVFPSLSEGFAKAPLEAMSTGTPVIVTENSGTPDIIEDGREGFVIEIRDSDALTERLEYCKAHPEKLEEMGRAARETAEQYPWQRYTEGVIDAIDDVV